MKSPKNIQKAEVDFSSSDKIYYDKLQGGWVVKSYELCKYVETHPRSFETVISNMPDAGKIRGTRGVQVLKGDQHKTIYHFLGKLFSPQQVEERRPHLRRCIFKQIDTFSKLLDSGSCDLAATLIDKLARQAITAFLGLPELTESQLAAYSEWDKSLTKWVGTNGQNACARLRAKIGAERFAEIFSPTIITGLLSPDSIPSKIHAFGKSSFETWCINDTIDQFKLLFLAGGEGIAQLLCTVAYQRLTNPKAKSSKITDVVEECLRMYAPAKLRPLRVLEEINIGNYLLKVGDIVYPDVDAANRDPSIHCNPNAFDPNRNPNLHLSFNAGSRFCIGANLSRVIVEETITILEKVEPSLSIPFGVQCPVLKGIRFRGFRPLIVKRQEEHHAT